jgi:hypothetical protein
MNNIYYTQEGTPYILKSISKNIPNWSSITGTIAPNVFVNINSDNSGVAYIIDLKTSKKIIPISLSFAALDNSNLSIFANVTSPYYACFRNKTTILNPLKSTFEQLRPLGKIIPFIDRPFFTDNQNFFYNVKYNDSVFSDVDFITPVGGFFIEFTSNQVDALTSNPSSIGFIPFVAGPFYNTSITFCYFEQV